jgi:hypothetical protein
LCAWSSIFVSPVRTEETGTTSPNLRHWLNVGVVVIRVNPRFVIGRLVLHLGLVDHSGHTGQVDLVIEVDQLGSKSGRHEETDPAYH